MQNSFKNYKIVFSSQATKELRKLEAKMATNIYDKLHELVSGSINSDLKKLSGVDSTYRLRCGDYRVIFEVKKHIVTILVIKVAHRKEVYRDY